MALLSIWRTVLKLRRTRACCSCGAHATLKLSENQPKVQFRSILRQQTMLPGCSAMSQRELELDANGDCGSSSHVEPGISNPSGTDRGLRQNDGSGTRPGSRDGRCRHQRSTNTCT